ncbi:RrF2 family transcriptional regulator [Clostridium felsineum]|uniref:Uncharacterized protein n=1 Tax=Clostridium felsineum TaxID=36839 RepID=A0A1S8L6Z1_9CLOT|nr:Rrf2 family transcriptional regulator [Clostridium felsineum]MCR3759639.1 Rrf2 family transcriptional regulator [Clostridium felsineum]URZ09708.1 hypothetical protein CROST_004010 [Clostridium felsineum]URZ18382.1 hypothetical protein CLFE_044520 [Clostridium felsineum DSM 794]
MQTKIAMEQAIYVIVILSYQKNRMPVKSRTLSNLLSVSDSYLKKILGQLVRVGILKSSANKNGGVYIEKELKEISFLDIFQAVEGEGSFFKNHELQNKVKIINKDDFVFKGLKTIGVFHNAEMQYKEVLRNFTMEDLLRGGDIDPFSIDLDEFMRGKDNIK